VVPVRPAAYATRVVDEQGVDEQIGVPRAVSDVARPAFVQI
jgi:hypothetical protein